VSDTRSFLSGKSFKDLYRDISLLARRGRFVNIRPYKRSAPAAVRTAREASLSVRGGRLFNLLPRAIRDITTGEVDQFKAELDTWLATVPDQPSIPGRQRAAKTNSLMDQVS
jgi:hypothetical protein